MPIRFQPLAALAGLLLIALPAQADKLRMKNGDVITGTVTKIEGEAVYIEPSYAEEFAVSLAEVASIEAEQTFDVSVGGGEQVVGQFAGSDGDAQVLVVDGREMSVELASVAVIPPPQPYYERSSHADVNMTWNDGNTDSRNNLIFADTRIRHGEHRHLAELTIRRDETDGISTKKQDLLRYSYNWMFSDPWYLGATASFERDPIRELDHRYTLGALVGRDIFNDDVKKMTISFGAGYSDEELAGVADSGAVGLFNFIYDHHFQDKRWNFFQTTDVQQQFYGDDNTIIKTNTGFRFKLNSVLYANLSLRYDYETEPAQGAENQDVTLAIGIGASF